jgi:hypothetical protein
MASRLPSIALLFPLESFPSQDIRPLLYRDLVTIPDEFSRYSDFKYRLWFIWYIWHHTTGNKWEPPWPAIVCGSTANRDLWLWQDEDEEAIRKFVNQDLRVSVILQMPVTAWNTGCQALEARLSPATVAASPLAHLPPKTRLRFIAWLLVAGPLRTERVLLNEDISGISILIHSWAQVTGIPLTGGTCRVCGVSGVLPVWIETMLEVYSRDNVGSLPLDHKCNCLHR